MIAAALLFLFCEGRFLQIARCNMQKCFTDKQSRMKKRLMTFKARLELGKRPRSVSGRSLSAKRELAITPGDISVFPRRHHISGPQEQPSASTLGVRKSGTTELIRSNRAFSTTKIQGVVRFPVTIQQFVPVTRQKYLFGDYSFRAPGVDIRGMFARASRNYDLYFCGTCECRHHRPLG